MYGTVRPFEVVVDATSAGIWSRSVNALNEPPVDLYWYWTWVGASHASSVASPRPNSAVVQDQGCSCGPEKIGPAVG
jgi:hypothetical protein